MNAYLIPMYLAYSAIALTLTLTLSRVLYRNGAVFLRDVFDDDDMAVAVNNLLVIGFFMLTSGISFVLLRSDTDLATAAVMVEELASKLGVLMLSLGTIHFANVYVFHRIRRRTDVAQLPPPVVPQRMTMPPPPGVGPIPAPNQTTAVGH